MLRKISNLQTPMIIKTRCRRTQHSIRKLRHLNRMEGNIRIARRITNRGRRIQLRLNRQASPNRFIFLPEDRIRIYRLRCPWKTQTQPRRLGPRLTRHRLIYFPRQMHRNDNTRTSTNWPNSHYSIRPAVITHYRAPTP